MAIYQTLPIDALQRGQYQPRQQFDETALRDLAASILSQGLIEPLIVRQVTPHRYEIIAGERRWRAAMMAGLHDIPCLIHNYTDEQTAAIALIENIQRQNLNLIEEAEGYQRLQTEFHFNQEHIADLIGKSRSHIANILRLLTLSPSVQNKIKSNALSLGHARALIGLSPSEQHTLRERIINEGWSVRRLEETLRLNKAQKEKPPSPISDRDVHHLQAQLSEQLGTPVHITSDDNAGGFLKIKFFDNDTLAGLLERLGLRYD